MRHEVPDGGGGASLGPDPPLLDRDFPARPRHIRTATSTVYRRGQEAR